MASSSPSTSPLPGLSHLAKAPNKAAVLKAFNRAFIHRDDGPHDEGVVAAYVEDFGLTEEEARGLRGGLLGIIQPVLYTGDVSEADRVLREAQVELDGRLLGLIKQILTVQLPEWKEASIMQRPSLPKMVDLDWRIDLKASSDQMRKVPPIPSVLLELEVQDQQTQQGVFPPTRKVNMELSKEALGTMLDGLRKIRDQLSSVTGTS